MNTEGDDYGAQGQLPYHMGGSPGEVGEVPVTQVKQRKERAVMQMKRWKGWRMSCDVGEAM